jgi:choline dehydrogenase
MIKPASRGMVQLASADPTAKPYILHNYYSEDSDMRAMVDALRLALEIARQRELEPFTRRPYYEMPASESDDDLRAYIREQTFTIYHPVGTCRMGADADAVVDPQLRVRGVEALRVVDASVMPTVPRGNTNAPTIAIAERAADLIRGRPAPSRAATEAGIASA